MVIDDKYLNVLMVGMKNLKRSINADHPLYEQVIELMSHLSDESMRISPPDLSALNAALQAKGWGTVESRDGKIDTSRLTTPQ